MVRQKLNVVPVLFALVGLVTGAEAKTSAANAVVSKGSICSDAAGVLRASLSDKSTPEDVLISEPPESPLEPHMALPGAKDDFWTSGWRGESPSAELLNRWKASTNRSIISCFGGSPTQITFRDMKGGWTGLETKENVRRRPGVVTFRVSAPTFDQHTGRALVLYSKTEKILGGRTGLILIGKTGRTWSIIGEKTLSVS